MDLFWVLRSTHPNSPRLPQSLVLSLICSGNIGSSLSLSVRICIVLAQLPLPYLIQLTMKCKWVVILPACWIRPLSPLPGNSTSGRLSGVRCSRGTKNKYPSLDHRAWGILLWAVLQADALPSDAPGWKTGLLRVL